MRPFFALQRIFVYDIILLVKIIKKRERSGIFLNSDILKSLLEFTDEEKEYLNGLPNSNDSFFVRDGEKILCSETLLKEGKLIDISAHARFSRCPPHTHNYIEVVYQCSGETIHIINGKKVVLREGELLFLPQESVQEVLPAGPNDLAVDFIILPQFFKNPFQLIGKENTPLHQFIIQALCSTKSTVAYLHFEVADIVPVQNLVDTLIWTLYNDKSGNYQIVEYTMGLLLLNLINFSYNLSPASTDDELIFATLQYVEKNYVSGSLSELAEKLGYNVTTLSTEIRRKTGKNYLDLIHEKRISQACFLLRNSSLAISQIAYEVGYNNSSFFHRLFKGMVGVSPKKFRTANSNASFAVALFAKEHDEDETEK